MQKYLTGLAVTALALVGATVVLASPRVVAEAKIPFEFRAATETLPAGTYDFLVDDMSSGVLRLQNRDTGKSTMLSVVTRLAPRGSDENLVVFDTQGDQHHLSEFFVSGEDGYAFAGASGLHAHTKVLVQKKK